MLRSDLSGIAVVHGVEMQIVIAREIIGGLITQVFIPVHHPQKLLGDLVECKKADVIVNVATALASSETSDLLHSLHQSYFEATAPLFQKYTIQGSIKMTREFEAAKQTSVPARFLPVSLLGLGNPREAGQLS